MSHPYNEVSPPSKRVRMSTEEEDPELLDKREKARERQRRKRERDKLPARTSDAPMDLELNAETPDSAKRKGGGKGVNLNGLPPEEAARRERVRNAARERQRKHRAVVKAKRMAELGMAIVNAGGGIEQTAIGYVINEDGQYEAVLSDPNDPRAHHPPLHGQAYPVPHPHPTAGHMFASTLLHALSSTPLLKQHLLRTLRVTHEDLAAFAPAIAASFDHWDHARALHYASQNYHPPSSYLSVLPQPDSHDRTNRPPGITRFPPGPHYGPEDSPSPSEGSHCGAGDLVEVAEPNSQKPEWNESFHRVQTSDNGGDGQRSDDKT